MHNARDMATPKPGEIRCPTCHRSTPPAAYCTQCGSPIPSDARIRPRGMDRDELQERIRARREGGDPYRRGSSTGEAAAIGSYGRFEPEPEDVNARREQPPADERVDRFDEAHPSPAPVLPPPEVTGEPEPERWERRHEPQADAAESYRPPDPPAPAPPYAQPVEERPAYAGHDEDRYEGEPGYAYEPDEYDNERWQDDRERSSGAGAFALVGFLALGVLALLGGALLAGVFGDGPGVADATPTPTATMAPSVEPTVAPTPPASAPGSAPAGSAPPGDGPVTFPDGMVGDVEPCATSEMSFDGCAVDGSTVSGDAVWAWMGFTDASGADSLVVSLISDGQTIHKQERVIGNVVECPDRCTGYLIQGYRGLGAGDYELLLERNGEFADRATLRVEG